MVMVISILVWRSSLSWVPMRGVQRASRDGGLEQQSKQAPAEGPIQTAPMTFGQKPQQISVTVKTGDHKMIAAEWWPYPQGHGCHLTGVHDPCRFVYARQSPNQGSIGRQIEQNKGTTDGRGDLKRDRRAVAMEAVVRQQAVQPPENLTQGQAFISEPAIEPAHEFSLRIIDDEPARSTIMAWQVAVAVRGAGSKELPARAFWSLPRRKHSRSNARLYSATAPWIWSKSWSPGSLEMVC
jgi:hypothetical protein